MCWVRIPRPEPAARCPDVQPRPKPWGQTVGLRRAMFPGQSPEDLPVSTAPHIDIDPASFWQDPYPTLARIRKEAPIAFVQQLGSTLLCARDDIFVSEKQIDVYSP